MRSHRAKSISQPTRPALLPIGSIVITEDPISSTVSCYTQFHKETLAGKWVIGSGEEQHFEDEDAAFRWLMARGCKPQDDSIELTVVTH